MQIMSLLSSMVCFVQLQDAVSTAQSIRLTELVFKPSLSKNLKNGVLCGRDVKSWEVCVDAGLEGVALATCGLILCAVVVRLLRWKGEVPVEDCKEDGGQHPRSERGAFWRKAFVGAILVHNVCCMIYVTDLWFDEDAGISVTSTVKARAEFWAAAPSWEKIGALVYLIVIFMAGVLCVCLMWASMKGKNVEKERLEGETDPMEEKIRWETGMNYATCMAV